MENSNKPSIQTAPKIPERGFFSAVFHALKSLWSGMKVTFHYFSHPSETVTQQYPENRNTLKIADRSRIQLTMVHDEQGFHKCSGCKICQNACPNASIEVTTRKNPTSGKNELDRYTWRMDSCTYCSACVQVCPFGTLQMEQSFEGAVYDRRLFVYTLNHYAGPTAALLQKITDPEERKKNMEMIDIYSGKIPLTGTSLAGLSTEIPEPEIFKNSKEKFK